jgi:hypothetical protein
LPESGSQDNKKEISKNAFTIANPLFSFNYFSQG